jgi:hypothetical protein
MAKNCGSSGQGDQVSLECLRHEIEVHC